ncbi:MAG TPA: GSCFA domain-containing protein [Saprospiraceae bacterium]|nr:GSCFA domain-containing protein [Saprospiraceae bacterium]
MLSKLPLYTPVNIETSARFTYNNRFLFIGSCFSEHIASKLTAVGFHTFSNPTGITYNPLSISQSIRNITHQSKWKPTYLEKKDDLFFSWSHHGSFKSTSEKDLLQRIDLAYSKAKECLTSSPVLILSWGTSVAHELKQTGDIVANCHKFPASNFNSFLIEPAQIVEEYTELFEELLGLYPDATILLTISPVRHLRDGLIANQRSKSALHWAAHELLRIFPDNVFYFPAYELMIDELRDYRYYARDLVHPNDLAVDYILQKFINSYFSNQEIEILTEIEQYNKLKAHRILFPESEQALDHIDRVEATYIGLREKYPQVIIQAPT